MSVLDRGGRAVLRRLGSDRPGGHAAAPARRGPEPVHPVDACCPAHPLSIADACGPTARRCVASTPPWRPSAAPRWWWTPRSTRPRRPCWRTCRGSRPRVAHLVRDPRGVAWSWSKHVDRPDADVPSQMARVGTVRIAGRWQLYNALLATARTPGSVVRYEELSFERPEHATRRLLHLGRARCGRPSTVPRRAHREAGGRPHRRGQPVAVPHGGVDIRADDGWRREMPASRQALLTALTFPSNLIYRYPP